MPSRFFPCASPLSRAPISLIMALALCAGTLQAQTASAPIQVHNAQGKVLDKAQAWKAPAAARMQFTVQGKIKSLPYQTKAQLDWLPQGQRYEASQEVQIPVLGSRRQASVGTINAGGLQPEIFLDRSRKEHSTTFDAPSGQIRFSRGNEPQPLVAGTQDRLSVFFQVAGMLAAAPKAYPVGTRITVQAASTSRVAPWTFTVRSTENLQLPAGRMAAIKLEHNSDSTDADGVQSALWIAPSLGYLPVRIRMVEDGGRDELDLKLASHSKP